jgi:phenylacetic acid degradation protein
MSRSDRKEEQMAHVYAIDGLRPVIAPDAFVHPAAVLIGDVIVGPGCYVGPGASLRGDFGRLILEVGSNIQDNCVMHGFPGKDCVIETAGHVGHGAILHGCRIGRNALVGMNAVVMDGAVVGEDSIVAALAFLKAGFEVPPRTLVGGIPARIMRPLSDDEIAWKSHGTAEYQELARRCLMSLEPVEPLTAPEPDRARLDVSKYKPLYETRDR